MFWWKHHRCINNHKGRAVSVSGYNIMNLFTESVRHCPHLPHRILSLTDTQLINELIWRRLFESNPSVYNNYNWTDPQTKWPQSSVNNNWLPGLPCSCVGSSGWWLMLTGCPHEAGFHVCGSDVPEESPACRVVQEPPAPPSHCYSHSHLLYITHCGMCVWGL